MAEAVFKLTYDGPALRSHEMNVRDLAPAMLGVGEIFESLNTLYNGKLTDVAVNVRAHEPGCFTVVFDILQHVKSGADFLAGTDVTAAINLREIVFGSMGLIWLIRKLRGRTPERIEKLTPNMFRLFIEDEIYDIPMELLQAFKELSVRRALERFVTRPLRKNGIDEVRVESEGREIARVDKQEAEYFKAPDIADDVIIDDTDEQLSPLPIYRLTKMGSGSSMMEATPSKRRSRTPPSLSRSKTTKSDSPSTTFWSAMSISCKRGRPRVAW